MCSGSVRWWPASGAYSGRKRGTAYCAPPMSAVRMAAVTAPWPNEEPQLFWTAPHFTFSPRNAAR